MDLWSGMDPTEVAGTADGVIIQGGSEETWAILRKRRVPVVQVGALRAPVPGVTTVLPDNEEAGRRAAEHFLGRGFGELAFLGARGHHYAEERRAGFLAAGGDAVRHQWVRAYNDAAGREALATWLGGLPSGTGLFASNDILARTAIRTLEAEGRRVPEDVAVVGVDDDEIESALSPVPLSSVDVRGDGVGQAAAQELARQLGAGGPGEDGGRVIRVPAGEVVVRRSSDILRVGHPALARSLALIREEAERRLDPAEVARASGVSRRTLERLFQKWLGRGIEAELRRARLERARALLANGELSIGEVAERASFRDIYHLSRAFGEAYGESPSSWRRRLLGGRAT